MPAPLIIPNGAIFGKLTVIKEDEPHVSGKMKCRAFVYRCSCEDQTIVSVRLSSLRSGLTVACGCYQKEIVSIVSTTHGLSKHPLYLVWYNMHARCYYKENNKYKYYGGKGIKVCREWHSNPKGIKSFIKWAESNGYKKGLEIDRYPNKEGDYKPSNCRWVTRTENCNNLTSNIIIKYRGSEIGFIKFWRKYNKGVSYDTACRRLKRGMKPMDCVTRPTT